MEILTSIILGLWFIHLLFIVIYLFSPKLYFVTVNDLPQSRFKTFVQMVGVNLLILVAMLIVVPKDSPLELSAGATTLWFFIGIFIGITFFIFGVLKKINKVVDIPIPKQEQIQPKITEKIIKHVESAKEAVAENIEKTLKTHADNISKKLDELEQKNKVDQPIEIPIVKSSLAQFNENIKNKPKETKPLIQDAPKLSLYRYELDYKDRFGNETTREIDIISARKVDGNNRWYFYADTEDGERTFKSQRVIELRDNWTGDIFDTAKAVREHILAEYEMVEDDDDY